MSRKASAFVCDEALFSLTGKITISGLYTQDIVIVSNEQQINQLVFLFTVETSKSQPFKSAMLKIAFPGGDPVLVPMMTVIHPASIDDDRRKSMVFRQPVLVPMPILRPGRIVASVLHEDGEMEAGGFWVVTMEEAQKKQTEATRAKG